MATIYYERFDIEDGGRLVGAHVYHKASCPPMRQRGIFMCGVAAPAGLCEIERIDAPFHVLIFVLGGEAELFEGERRWQVGPGQFGMLPPGGQKGFRRLGDEAMPHVWFLLRDHERWNHLPRGSPWVDASGEGPALYDAVSLFQREAARQNAGERDALMLPALDLVERQLERALGAYRPPSGRAQALQTVLAQVTQAAHEPWPVARLAAELGVTQSHLHRLCREHLGQSPGQLVFAARMHAARAMLQAGGRVGEVATAVGYAEVASFSRRCREFFGVSPSALQAGKQGR